MARVEPVSSTRPSTAARAERARAAVQAGAAAARRGDEVRQEVTRKTLQTEQQTRPQQAEPHRGANVDVLA